MIAAAQLEILQETILTKEITLTRCASSQNVMSAVRSTAITNYNSHTYTSRMFILDQLTSSMFHEEYWSTATNNTYWNTATNDDTSRAESGTEMYIQKYKSIRNTEYRTATGTATNNAYWNTATNDRTYRTGSGTEYRTATGSVATKCRDERTVQHISRLPDHE